MAEGATIVRASLREGLLALLARPRLLFLLAGVGLVQMLLVEVSVGALVLRLESAAGPLSEGGSSPAAHLVAAALAHPERLSAGLGLVLVSVLTGRVLHGLALAGALAGCLGGRRGASLTAAALREGPRLFLLSFADSAVWSTLVIVGAIAAVAAGSVWMTVGSTAGAVAFALCFGPAAAGLLVAYLTLRVATLAVALGHALGRGLVEASEFVRRELGALLRLGGGLVLRWLPLLLLAGLVSSLATRAGTASGRATAAGVVSLVVLALVQALTTLWGYASLFVLGRRLTEPDEPILPPETSTSTVEATSLG